VCAGRECESDVAAPLSSIDELIWRESLQSCPVFFEEGASSGWLTCL
jgi:hypothetical protein